jgi:hypothetical protein
MKHGLNTDSSNAIRELPDDTYRERILRARAMPPEEKLLAGPRLFEQACEIMKDKIRRQFPDAEEACVDAILIEIIKFYRRLDQCL